MEVEVEIEVKMKVKLEVEVEEKEKEKEKEKQKKKEKEKEEEKEKPSVPKPGSPASGFQASPPTCCTDVYSELDIPNHKIIQEPIPTLVVPKLILQSVTPVQQQFKVMKSLTRVQ